MQTSDIICTLRNHSFRNESLVRAPRFSRKNNTSLADCFSSEAVLYFVLVKHELVQASPATQCHSDPGLKSQQSHFAVALPATMDTDSRTIQTPDVLQMQGLPMPQRSPLQMSSALSAAPQTPAVRHICCIGAGYVVRLLSHPCSEYFISQHTGSRHPRGKLMQCTGGT